MSALLEHAASVVVRTGGSFVHRVRSAGTSTTRDAGRGQRRSSGWLVVTVLRELSEMPAGAPEPLGEFGDRVEVRVHPAAGGKGTELAARLRDSPSAGSRGERLSGEDPQAELRSALRQAKQLLEVGEVLAVDPAPHGRRTATPGGLLLEAATRVAPRAGVR